MNFTLKPCNLISIMGLCVFFICNYLNRQLILPAESTRAPLVTLWTLNKYEFHFEGKGHAVDSIRDEIFISASEMSDEIDICGFRTISDGLSVH